MATAHSIVEQIFLDHVVRIPASGCWAWTGPGRGGEGFRKYGGFSHNGETHYAHRFAYQLFNGVIPNGLCVLHRCDIPFCVNPAHLMLGTRIDNNADRDRKGRSARGDRHGSRVRPNRLRRGEAHPGAKLTASQVVEIKRRLQEGTPSWILSKEYSVKPRSIRDIKNGVTWKHV